MAPISIEGPGGESGVGEVAGRDAGDALARFLGLRAQPSRLVLGLLSGTSADGTDAALCEIAGSGEATDLHVLAFAIVPFERALRERIFGLSQAPNSELADVNVLLGQAFAAAATEVCRIAGVQMEEVDLIGSHGQTAVHHPRSAGKLGATLQIGEAAVIAERTGRPVVSDFRVRDVAAGGEGAPLVPLVDFILFRKPAHRRALQNIGGIANVTLVGERLADLIAFDNAPGNMPLDAVARAASAGQQAFDVDGRRAARGTIDRALLDELHQHPYLALPPPKSTGRELFGRDFVNPLLARFEDRKDDLLATLTRFSAEAIARSYREVFPAPPTEVYVSGGGALNLTLMHHLGDLLAPIPVATTDALGVDPKAKEAIAFAVLANETLFGHAGNVPRVTGAAGPRVLGKITL
ncbi:MAG TPA: anhydro-N-acetylmuramic acid kinase [Polyangia bacterium]|jgi:anhydro-N-acetylmuramic acid kinase|nr:anhydro-N-acetylmuramic acid kinase [Polyangia bacterium]